jgi:hypothetical protein
MAIPTTIRDSSVSTASAGATCSLHERALPRRGAESGHASSPSPTLSPEDQQILDTALAASSWRIVDHFVFVRKIPLASKEPIFRALLMDTTAEGLELFKKLLIHDLRLQRVVPPDQRTALENQFNRLLDAAIKHSHGRIVKLLLGEDRDFNRVVKIEVGDSSGFHTSTFASRLSSRFSEVCFGRNTLKGPEEFSRDMQAMGMAGAHGRADMISLIKARLNANRVSTEPFEAEALKLAAAHGRLDTMRLLLHSNVSEAGISAALVAAAASNKSEAVRMLRERASPTARWEATTIAAARGHIDLAKSLSDNPQSLSQLWTESLKSASELGDVDVANQLLSFGADPRHNNSDALRRAAKGAHADVVRVLLANGADPRVIPSETLVALEARRQGAFVREMLEPMLTAGFDPTSLLLESAPKGSGELLLRALESGINIKRWENQLLQASLKAGASEVANHLLERPVLLKCDEHSLLGTGWNAPTIASQVATMVLVAFNCSSHDSRTPDDLSGRISRMNAKDLGLELANILHQASNSQVRRPENAYPFMIRSHLRQCLLLIKPNISAAETENRIGKELATLEKKTETKKQLLNRVGMLQEKLAGIDEMIAEMSDGLILGIQQEKAGAGASKWTSDEIQRRRKRARETVSEHLLNNFDMPTISRLFTLWKLPTHRLAQAARPLFTGSPDWVPLISGAYRMPNGIVVRCLKTKRELLETGHTLDNCIKGEGYHSASLLGTASLFTFTRPDDTVVAALELGRALGGNIQASDGSTWCERQFRGPSNGYPPADAMEAKNYFIELLASRKLPTNRVPLVTNATDMSQQLPVEFITGIPIGGSAELIRKHYQNACVPAKDGKKEIRLIPPQSSLHNLIQ